MKCFVSVVLIVLGGITAAWVSSNLFDFYAWAVLGLYLIITTLFLVKLLGKKEPVPYFIIIPATCALLVHTPVHKAPIYGPGLLIGALIVSFGLSVSIANQLKK